MAHYKLHCIGASGNSYKLALYICSRAMSAAEPCCLPLVKITDAEIARIRDALIEAGLLGTRTVQGRNAA